MKSIMAIIQQIACAICHSTTKPKPKIELLSMPSEDVKSEIAGLKLLYPTLLDYFQPYYYTKAEDWAEVLDYIYFKFDMPKYLAAKMDCEDFGILLKGLVSSFFGLNYFGVVFGNTPAGYHGYNVFRTEKGLLQLEPQTGNIGELGEGSYKAEYILL